jgi:hypothetical protein
MNSWLYFCIPIPKTIPPGTVGVKARSSARASVRAAAKV